MATRNTPVDQPEAATADAGAQQADDAEQSGQAATSGARMPSISSMIRYMAPDAIAERRRKARENFGRVTPLPNGVAEVADDSSKVAADAPPTARVSAPSPWARSRDGEIDKAALPSATMPIVPPTSSDVAGPEERDDAAAPRARDRRHTWLIVAICAAVAVVGPILMILVGRTRRPIEEGRGAATASVHAAATATPSASAPTPSASALPSAPSAASTVEHGTPEASALAATTPAARTSAPPPPSAPPRPPRRRPPQTPARDGGAAQPAPVSSDFVQE